MARFRLYSFLLNPFSRLRAFCSALRCLTWWLYICKEIIEKYQYVREPQIPIFGICILLHLDLAIVYSRLQKLHLSFICFPFFLSYDMIKKSKFILMSGQDQWAKKFCCVSSGSNTKHRFLRTRRHKKSLPVKNIYISCKPASS